MTPTPEHDRIRRAVGMSLLLHAAAWLLLSSDVPARSRPEPVPIALIQHARIPPPPALPPRDTIAQDPEPLRKRESPPATREARVRRQPAAPVPPRASPAPPHAPAAAPSDSAADTAGPSAPTSGSNGRLSPGAGNGEPVASSPDSASGAATAALRPPVCPQSAVSYPAEARRRGIEGEVTARLLVREDGSIGDATIVHSAGASLDEAVLEAVRTLRCEPARLGNRPVSSPVPYTVRFVLEDS